MPKRPSTFSPRPMFLHFRHGRDDNTLDWQSQDEAAAKSSALRPRHRRPGLLDADLLSPCAHHLPPRRSADGAPARPGQLLSPVPPRRTPIAGTDFILDQGRIDIVPGAQFNDTSAILRIFSLMATHGYMLSQAAETASRRPPALAIHIPKDRTSGTPPRSPARPHAAHALRTMHALGVLEMLIRSSMASMRWSFAIAITVTRWTSTPSCASITCTACANLSATTKSAWLSYCLKSTASICSCWRCSSTTRQGPPHRRACGQSVELADAFLARLDFDTEERESILKLIRLHLEMSNACARHLRPGKRARLPEKIGSPALLKMLTVMTFADIKAVNPEA